MWTLLLRFFFSFRFMHVPYLEWFRSIQISLRNESSIFLCHILVSYDFQSTLTFKSLFEKLIKFRVLINQCFLAKKYYWIDGLACLLSLNDARSGRPKKGVIEENIKKFRKVKLIEIKKYHRNVVDILWTNIWVCERSV